MFFLIRTDIFHAPPQETTKTNVEVVKFAIDQWLRCFSEQRLVSFFNPVEAEACT